MSISPVDVPASSAGQTPSASVGKASPTPDPIASTGGVVTAPASSKAKPSDSEISSAVDAINSSNAFNNSSLSFSVDRNTGETIVKITDVQTDKVIQQIPSEDALKLAASIDKMQEKKQGNLINDKA